VVRSCLALGLLLLTAACDKPSDYLPKEPVALEKPALPQAQAVQLVREIVGPCERAMERASGVIGVMATAGSPPAAARDLVTLTKSACASAFAQLQGSDASGDVRDACLAAAYARESVADTALEILEGRATPITVSTLQYKAADQATASRACVAALGRTG
jgi:hypothetical protein